MLRVAVARAASVVHVALPVSIGWSGINSESNPSPSIVCAKSRVTAQSGAGGDETPNRTRRVPSATHGWVGLLSRVIAVAPFVRSRRSKDGLTDEDDDTEGERGPHRAKYANGGVHPIWVFQCMAVRRGRARRRTRWPPSGTTG